MLKKEEKVEKVEKEEKEEKVERVNFTDNLVSSKLSMLVQKTTSLTWILLVIKSTNIWFIEQWDKDTESLNSYPERKDFGSGFLEILPYQNKYPII